MFINKSLRYLNFFLKKNLPVRRSKSITGTTQRIIAQMSESLSIGLLALFFIALTNLNLPSEMALEEMLTPFRKQS